jgi:predicted phosphoadenosine phosphosulfate sulfurtransferase
MNWWVKIMEQFITYEAQLSTDKRIVNLINTYYIDIAMTYFICFPWTVLNLPFY